MKEIFILISGIMLMLSGCSGDIVIENVPNCIEKKINDIAKEQVWNPPAKVYRYQYNGETVYYFSSKCCDFPSAVYDEDCNFICAPDGGFTGEGDGKCPDFSETATDGELIWEDPR